MLTQRDYQNISAHANEQEKMFIQITKISNISFSTCKYGKTCPYAEMTKTSNLILRPCERKRKHQYNAR
jgi:hypothetical protein